MNSTGINLIRYFLSIILVLELTMGCSATRNQIIQTSTPCGQYRQIESGRVLLLGSDNTYVIIQDPQPQGVERCDVFSRGSWSCVADNVIEITSEDFYQRQKGYEYVLTKEKKFSPDSLYINVILPEDYGQHYYSVSFYFSGSSDHSFKTNSCSFVLSKSKYFWGNWNLHPITLAVLVRPPGTYLYTSRLWFDILKEEPLDLERYNYLTIYLPNFDQCFIEFKPYYHDYILIKDKYTLKWNGRLWSKQ